MGTPEQRCAYLLCCLDAWPQEEHLVWVSGPLRTLDDVLEQLPATPLEYLEFTEPIPHRDGVQLKARIRGDGVLP